VSTSQINAAVAELRDNGFLSDDTLATLNHDELLLVTELAQGEPD
jgi:hypothetical protein